LWLGLMGVLDVGVFFLGTTSVSLVRLVGSVLGMLLVLAEEEEMFLLLVESCFCSVGPA
jgi:hypothetical protein